MSLFGDQYISEGAPEREPVLSEFSKTAIAMKRKLRDEAEKPKNNTWQETARCDNLYIKSCQTAMQNLRRDWQGDDNQVQMKPSAIPSGNCCCFSCLKVAKKVINFHPARLSLEETEQEEIEREQAFMSQVRPLVDSDSEDELEFIEPEKEGSDDESDDGDADDFFKFGFSCKNCKDTTCNKCFQNYVSG